VGRQLPGAGWSGVDARLVTSICAEEGSQMQVNRVLLNGAAIAALIAAGAFIPASAQTANTSHGSALMVLPDIVIQARRVSENQQQVPLAVSTLTGDALDRDTVTTVDDLQKSIPSFVVAPSAFGGEASPNFAIRGLSGALVADPSVVAYFDEVATDPRNFAYEMFDLASVQVLKGPQGTLFGRNSTGGAIVFVPERPGPTLSGFADFRYGRFDDREFTGAINLPVAKWLQFRLSGEGEMRDGTIKSLTGGPTFNDRDHKTLRLQALMQLSDNVENYAAGTLYRARQQNNPPTLSAVATCPDPFAVQPESECFFEPPLTFGLGTPDITAELAQQQAAGKDKSVNNASQPFNIDVAALTDILTMHWGDVTIKNIAHVDYSRYHLGLDFDGSTANIVDQDDQQNNHFFSEEFQLLGKSLEDHLQWIVGAYYSDYRQNQRDVFHQVDFPGNPLNPIFETVSQPQKSTAIFGQGTLSLGELLDGLSITAGYRYTWDKRAISDQRLEGNPAFICGLQFLSGPNAGQFFPGVDPATCTRHLSEKFHDDTYNLSLNWQVAPNTLIYLAHRKGYKSGGFNFTASDPGFVSYQPEELKDLELGLKSDWQLGTMWVRSNIAIFGAKYQNIQQQTTVFDPISGNLEVLVLNQDPATGLKNKATLKGGEVELTLIPTSGLELTAFYGITQSNYDQFMINGLDLKGEDILGIAPTTIGASLVFTPNLGDSWAKPSLFANYYHRTTLTTNTIDTSPPLEGYSTLDLRLEFANLCRGPLTLSFYGDNVTNERFQVFSIDVGATRAIQYSEPAKFGVELSMRFGARD
jgi:iron complex outermembrane receptor protein